MIDEDWKDIKGYEGLYQVSNLGRVMTVKSKRLRKINMTHDGYCKINLSSNGESHWFRVHRLVAQAFIPNPEHKPEVNHIDEDKTNNNVDNLEWVTRKENANHGTLYGRLSKINGTSIICVESGVTYDSMSQCARLMKIQQSSISQMLSGKRKSAGGYTFKLKEKNK